MLGSYEVDGREQFRQDPLLKYCIHKLHLDSNQRDESEFDSTFVPSPKIEERFSHTFTLPVAAKIRYDNHRLFLSLAAIIDSILRTDISKSSKVIGY
jgi:hypothetical protein